MGYTMNVADPEERLRNHIRTLAYDLSQRLYDECGGGCDQATREYEDWMLVMGYRNGLGGHMAHSALNTIENNWYKMGFRAATIDVRRIPASIEMRPPIDSAVGMA